LHNKPIGCCAAGAYALGPDDGEEEEENMTKTTGTLREDLYTFIISHIIL
jgi:hypothetical protein